MSLRSKFITTRLLDTSSFAIYLSLVGSSNTPPTTKYRFTTDVTLPGAKLVSYMAAVQGGFSAAGNATFGIFTQATVSNKYTFASNSTAVATGLPNQDTFSPVAVGNDVKALFVRGGSGIDGNKLTATYDFVSNLTATSTDLLNKSVAGAAMGTLTMATIVLGCVDQSGHPASNKDINQYKYSDATVTAATSMPLSFGYGSATSTPTYGFIIYGNGQAYFKTTYKYLYATSTIVPATDLANTQLRGCGTGNDTVAYVAGGLSSYASRYTYATDTSINTTAIVNQAQNSGVSNGVSGVNM